MNLAQLGHLPAVLTIIKTCVADKLGWNCHAFFEGVSVDEMVVDSVLGGEGGVGADGTFEVVVEDGGAVWEQLEWCCVGLWMNRDVGG